MEQLDNPGVFDFFIYKGGQLPVVNVVKEPFDVSFHEPSHTGITVLDVFERCMATPIWPESVGRRQENRLIHCFQYHLQHFLHQLVCKRRNTQGAQFSIPFGYVCPAHRGWRIGSIFQGLNDGHDFLLTEPVGGIVVYTFGGRAVVGIQMFVCEIVNIRSEHVPEKPSKLHLLVCFGSLTNVFQYGRCWFHGIIHSLSHARYSSLISFLIGTTNCVPSPCNGRYPSRTTMDAPLPYQIFSGTPHSHFWRSDLGNPRLALMLGCRLSESLSSPWHWFSSASCDVVDNPHIEYW